MCLPFAKVDWLNKRFLRIKEKSKDALTEQSKPTVEQVEVYSTDCGCTFFLFVVELMRRKQTRSFEKWKSILLVKPYPHLDVSVA